MLKPIQQKIGKGKKLRRKLFLIEIFLSPVGPNSKEKMLKKFKVANSRKVAQIFEYKEGFIDIVL